VGVAPAPIGLVEDGKDPGVAGDYLLRLLPPGPTFQFFGEHEVSGNGYIAVRVFDAPRRILRLAPGSTLPTVVGDDSEGVFRFPNSPKVNNNGDVIFFGDFDLVPGPGIGIGIFTNSNFADRVVATGDLVDGFPVGQPTSGPSALNDSGQIVFRDGTNRLILADPGGGNAPPEITFILDPLVLEGDTTGGFDAAGLTPTVAGITTDDPDAGPDPVTLSNDAPAVLPLDDTTVEWTASDGEDSDTATHTVTVEDTTAPTVAVPADIDQVAASPLGDVINYAASADDIVDPAPAFDCVPASGTTFPLGDTTVDCSASDASENDNAASFLVTITLGQTTFDGFVAKIEGLGLENGLTNALRVKVQSAAGQFASGNASAATSSLNALLNQVSAQEGKKLTSGQADTLRDCANALLDALAA
jgi:hypothetical protein